MIRACVLDRADDESASERRSRSSSAARRGVPGRDLREPSSLGTTRYTVSARSSSTARSSRRRGVSGRDRGRRSTAHTAPGSRSSRHPGASATSTGDPARRTDCGRGSRGRAGIGAARCCDGPRSREVPSGRSLVGTWARRPTWAIRLLRGRHTASRARRAASEQGLACCRPTVATSRSGRSQTVGRAGAPPRPRAVDTPRATPILGRPRRTHRTRERRGVLRAGDGHLRRELRHGRQAADRAAQGCRHEQVPADLDRASRGRRDPDEAPGRVDAAADDARPAVRHARRARRRVHAASRSPSCARTPSTRRSRWR